MYQMHLLFSNVDSVKVNQELLKQHLIPYISLNTTLVPHSKRKNTLYSFTRITLLEHSLQIQTFRFFKKEAKNLAEASTLSSLTARSIFLFFIGLFISSLDLGLIVGHT